ncbi:hypothetical protein AVEN_99597-1 [Araneus ventricosus]|uniref:Uncharacterized protein n=1 Tax=Araneus ventricosus TaxID=182803 RepID=A0A4Y2ETL7_ARAVE|nr:hypothetical protein AVEN_99597-1 [Araneus ventricosus]
MEDGEEGQKDADIIFWKRNPSQVYLALSGVVSLLCLLALGPALESVDTCHTRELSIEVCFCPRGQPDEIQGKPAETVANFSAKKLTKTEALPCRFTWFGLCSKKRVCAYKGDPNHCATDCPVTKPFHFMKPSAENISTWCENIVQ